MRRNSKELNIFSMSALDLFASALGAFILLTLVLIPYYLKTSESEQSGQPESGDATQEEVAEAQQRAEQAERELAELKRKMGKLEAELSKVKAKDLDLVFMMDTTASMQDQIDDLKKSIVGIVKVLDKVSNSLNVGFIAYRDVGQAYLTKEFPLTSMDQSGISRLNNFIGQLEAHSNQSNREFEEAVLPALQSASKVPWRSGDTKHFMLLIADAAAKDHEVQQSLQIARNFHNQDTDKNKLSAIFTLTEPFQGNLRPGSRRQILKDKSINFMKQLSQAGGGDFVEDRGHMLESVLMSIL